MNNSVKGNVAMAASKTFSGFNQNALRYLLPNWMSAYSGVVLRLSFGSIFFWIMSFIKPDKTEKSTTRDKLLLFILGAICVFGYMFSLLMALTYTTPVTSSIFLGMEPGVVYILCLILGTETLSRGKVFGLALGVAGLVVCILTQQHSEKASNPLLGNIFCFLSGLLFAIYLIAEKKFLKRLSTATVSKWTFTGGLFSSIIMTLIVGWDAPVLHQSIFSTPMLVLAFVLIFPTSISYLLMDIGLKYLPATVVALYGNLVLIISTVASYVFKQDHFSWWQMLAIGLMLASVYWVEIAEQKTTQPSNPPAPQDVK